MEKLNVENKVESGCYEILIGGGLLDAAGEWLGAFIPNSDKTVVVSDENVYRLYGERVMSALADAGADVAAVLIPPGESSKTLTQLESIYDLFGDIGLKRGGLVVALGGGVVGDIAGFAAATWMRGVPMAQLPTTLLAQVDSSVGGKTAVDTPAGKNMVGAFSRPVAVLADTEVLSTLPPREYASGMAEVIKYGAIASADLFAKLTSISAQSNPNQGTYTPPIISGNKRPHAQPYAFAETAPSAGTIDESVIATCCAIKAGIVSEDEFDTGRRQILNFGHTFGHALEAMHGFKKYTHGEAVAQGMVIAAAAGEVIGLTPRGTAERVLELTRAYGLPDPEGNLINLAAYIGHDKKSSADGVSLILLEDIGRAVIRKFTFDEVESLLGKVEGDIGELLMGG
jgi:3-dehydroquinate synthase